MADITTIAELGTAGGTLILAVATFGSVRSANRAARVAERSHCSVTRHWSLEGTDPRAYAR
jgi:hypothetical protein